MTDYREKIKSMIKKMKLKEMDFQIETVNEILNAYLDMGKKYVILSAATGVGKSIIAVLVSKILKDELIDRDMVSDEQKEYYNTVIMMHTNALIDQYENFFKSRTSCLRLNSAVNYNCEHNFLKADECMVNELKKFKPNLYSVCLRKCEFLRSRMNMNLKDIIFSNYAYMINIRIFTDAMSHKMLEVYDETHLMNDSYASQMETTVTDGELNYMLKICKEFSIHNSTIKEEINIIKNMIKNEKIGPDNSYTVMENVDQIIKEIFKPLFAKRIVAEQEKNINALKMLMKPLGFITKKMAKFDLAQNHKYEIFSKLENGFSVKPVFMKRLFYSVNDSDYSLFMSATITEKYLKETLCLKTEDVYFLKSQYKFEPHRKSLIFENTMFLNYKSMTYENIKKIAHSILEIINKKHNTEKGVIITNSFFVSNIISRVLKENDIYTIEHPQGGKVIDFITKFKSLDRPSVLISPSIFEGTDFPDDQSRFQFIVKTPYASLGDNRIKFIADYYPGMYQLTTLYKLIQCFGRSTRNPNDYSVSYCIDSNIKRIFDSDDNIWKEEFQIIENNNVNIV